MLQGGYHSPSTTDVKINKDLALIRFRSYLEQFRLRIPIA